MRSFVRDHQLATFLILAFALSWWPWPMTLVNPDSIAMIPWGPAVAALLISWLALGGAGVGQLVRRLGQWRVGLRWFGAAIGIPLAAWALAVVVAVLVFDGQLVASLTPMDLLIFPVSFLTTTLIKGPLTEEIGWRGFALPRMLQSQRPLQASLVLGLIWFTWHLPLVLTDPTRPVLPFALSVVAFSVILTWLYLATAGSLLIAVLFHGAVNTIASFVVPLFAPEDQLTVWWVFVAAITVTASAVAASYWFTVEDQELTLARERTGVSSPAQ
jgi:membrane protease YdiL (CAAX protease family)